MNLLLGCLLLHYIPRCLKCFCPEDHQPDIFGRKILLSANLWEVMIYVLLKIISLPISMCSAELCTLNKKKNIGKYTPSGITFIRIKLIILRSQEEKWGNRKRIWCFKFKISHRTNWTEYTGREEYQRISNW